MKLLSLNNINKHYEDNQVLKNVNLTIKDGEFFTFLGPSGCGKTTLLRIIAGFISHEEGQIIFEDKEITNLPAEKRNVGMVFQNYALFPFMNVYENVAYGLKIKKEKKQIIEEKVKKYLKIVRLEGYEKRNISELSGGEQQRVALARSLVTQPQLLLLDEPLSNLDARLRDNMRKELKEIQSTLGITTIFVTHDQTEALTMSDRIAVFNKGECVQVGTPDEIYSEPVNTFVANFIGETNLLEAKIENNKVKLSSNTFLNISSEAEGDFISIRPQDIMITNNLQEKHNVITGTISQLNISGHLLEYVVQVDEIVLKIIELNQFTSQNHPQIGQEISLYIHPNAIKVLKDK